MADDPFANVASSAPPQAPAQAQGDQTSAPVNDPFSSVASSAPPSSPQGYYGGALHLTVAPNQAPQGTTPQVPTQFGDVTDASGTNTPDPSTGQTPGVAKTALDQGLQGATFGFADEATDRMGAAIASTVTGEPYDDMLQEAQKQTKQDLANEAENRPVESLASQLGGALATGAYVSQIAAATPVGAMLGRSVAAQGAGPLVRAGTTAANIAKTTGMGAASGAIYGAGTADPGQREAGAESGAIAGGLTGAAAPALGHTLGRVAQGAGDIAKGLTARSSENIEKTAEKIHANASSLYKKSASKGAVLTDKAASDIGATLDKAVPDATTQASKKLYRGNLKAIKDFHADVKSGNVGLETLDRHRQIFGNIAKDINNPNKAQEAAMASQIIEHIDDHVNSLTANDIKNQNTEAVDLLKQARDEWSKSKKFETVADVLKKADGDPSKIKAGLHKLVDNPKKIMGFRPNEVEAIKNASKGKIGYKTLKALGSFGIDLSHFDAAHVMGKIGGEGLAAHEVAGQSVPHAAILAGALTGVGTVAKQTQKYLVRGQAERVMQTLEKQGYTTSKIAKMPPKQFLELARKAAQITAVTGAPEAVVHHYSVGVK